MAPAAAQPSQQRAAAEEASQEDIEAALCCLLLGTIQVHTAFAFAVTECILVHPVGAKPTATGPVAATQRLL